MKKDFRLSTWYINGVRNAKLELKGYCKTKSKIKIFIDGVEKKYENRIILDKEYVVNKIKGIKTDDFDIYVSLEKKDKIVEVYYDQEVFLKKNVSLFSRMSFRICVSGKKFFSKLKRLPKIVVKTIRLMWQRHHFLVPPRMMKQYLRSFSNNMENKNVDELFYNPLVDNDYQKWLEENEEKVG